MRFSEYPFLRYTLFFAMGVLLYPYLNIGLKEIAALAFLFLATYCVLIIIDASQIRFQFKLLFPIVAYAQLMSAGLFFTCLKDVQHDASHLLYHDKIDGYLGVVTDLDQKKPNSFANRVMVSAVRKEGEYIIASGEVIIYHKLSENLTPGDLVWVQGNPTTIPASRNPKEFDYRKFLARQQIYHSHYVNTHLARLGTQNHSPINNFVLRVRASIQDRMDRFIPTPHSNQIAKALLLGQNKSIDREVSEAYITAGTMHILAVSGLHVGIVYGFFFLFIKPQQLSGNKRVIYLTFVLLIIWLYALITGMSPSVMRAATMFTLMGLAQMKTRTPSIYNSLALSALILLVFDPYILFSVGFQLSYLAVLGIVMLQPKIVAIWHAPNKVLQYFWEITSVGIAAQLATFPISAHYFHVFPSYFMISNLIAIPGAFLIMSVGIPFMLFSFIAPVGLLLGKVLDWIIRVENSVMFGFQRLPYARIEHINLPLMEMFLFWLLIVSLYLLAAENRRKYTYWSLVAFSGLVIANWLALWNDYQRNELYIYHAGKELAVDHFYRGRLYSRMETVSIQDISYKILPHRISMGHSISQEIKHGEDGQARYLFLPGGAFLQLSIDSFELEAGSIGSISLYEEGKWLSLDVQSNQEQKEKSFRIVMR